MIVDWNIFCNDSEVDCVDFECIEWIVEWIVVFEVEYVKDLKKVEEVVVDFFFVDEGLLVMNLIMFLMCVEDSFIVFVYWLKDQIK